MRSRATLTLLILFSACFSQSTDRFAFTGEMGTLTRVGIFEDGGTRFISPPDVVAHDPIIRPNTNEVFYLVSASSQGRMVYSTNAANGETQKWGDGQALIGGLAFSPDGQFLYFVSNEKGSPDVYRRNLTDGSVDVIANSEWPEFDPTLTKDGKELVYVEWTDEGYILHSWNTVNKSHRIVLRDETLISNVRWSTKDYSLIYVRNSENYWEIKEYFPLRDSTYQIRWGIPSITTPCFTPSGRQLYYSMEVNGQWDIYAYKKSSDKHNWMINGKEDELKPIFHPSGDWYWYNESTKKGWRVMKKVVRGKSARALIDSKEFSAYDAVWFPIPE